ncbi:MAG: heavy-metal-associated domain-containing protein [Candidatus Nanopelagicales bacterium]
MSTRTLTIEVTGMHCPSCGILIDDCMEDVDGVIASQTSIKTGLCVATVTDAVPDNAVLAAVTEAGYTGRVLSSSPA